MKNETTLSTAVQPQSNAPAAIAATTALSIFATSEAFEQAQRAAKLLAASDLLPTQFRNNIPNCVVGMEMANRLGASPFAVFQNLYVVHGRPGWSSQFLIAMVNASGRFSPLQFRMDGQGDNRSCVAWAKDKSSGEVIEGPPVTMAMAKAEGWSTKAGSKWITMPEVMLRYRAASFFAKFYCPDITMGMQTAEEVADMDPPIRNVTRPESFSEALAGTLTTPNPDPKPPTEPVAVEVVEEAPKKVDAAPQPAAQEEHPDKFRAYVEGVTQKNGTKNGKPWTAWFLNYTVAGANGPIKEAVTFSASLGEIVETLEEGALVLMAVKPGEKGRGDQLTGIELAPDESGTESQPELEGDGW